MFWSVMKNRSQFESFRNHLFFYRKISVGAFWSISRAMLAFVHQSIRLVHYLAMMQFNPIHRFQVRYLRIILALGSAPRQTVLSGEGLPESVTLPIASHSEGLALFADWASYF